MIGDWVRSISRNEVCKVHEIAVETVGVLIELRPNGNTYQGTHWSTQSSEFEEIPLIPEILLLNGFTWYEGDSSYTFSYKERDSDCVSAYISWYPGERVIEVNRYLLHGVGSVHKFQQALRLCGLDSMANNFKIK